MPCPIASIEVRVLFHLKDQFTQITHKKMEILTWKTDDFLLRTSYPLPSTRYPHTLITCKLTRLIPVNTVNKSFFPNAAPDPWKLQVIRPLHGSKYVRWSQKTGKESAPQDKKTTQAQKYRKI